VSSAASAEPSTTAARPFITPRWACWLAGSVTLAVYTFSAGGHSFWLDCAEFTAAALNLDIAHPPGHPVASLWGHVFTLLPVGPLPYRVAMAQAVAAALAASALQVAFARTFHAAGLRDPRLLGVFSLGCLGCLAFAYGYWFQAVRAEVYALQALLIALALERLIALAADETRRDPRALYAAALYLGIGLANHHFMSVLALPAALLGFVQTLRRHGPRVIAWCTASGGVGLVSYLYLPLRAASNLPMDLGHPVDWTSFWWVVSARVYARRIGSQATQPMGERFADLVVILADHFSFASLPLAALGLYVVLRERKSWSIGYVWGVTALVCLCGRAWLNPVRNNPDVLGYMLPGFAGYVVLCGYACLALVHGLRAPRLRERAARLLAAASVALAALQLVQTRTQASLADFHATDDFDRARLLSLPADAALIVTTPETAFRHWENLSVERVRPDVDMVPTAFVNYGGMIEGLLARTPELTPAVRAFQHEGVLQPASFDTLLALRPVMVEPDLIAAWPLFDRLLPAGLLYRLLPAPASAEQRKTAAAQRSVMLQQLQQQLGRDLLDTATRRQLLWCHYVDALYQAHHGELSLALASVASGLALVPAESELLRLRELLQKSPQRFSLSQFVRAP
jgi:hypothetical protein